MVTSKRKYRAYFHGDSGKNRCDNGELLDVVFFETRVKLAIYLDFINYHCIRPVTIDLLDFTDHLPFDPILDALANFFPIKRIDFPSGCDCPAYYELVESAGPDAEIVEWDLGIISQVTVDVVTKVTESMTTNMMNIIVTVVSFDGEVARIQMTALKTTAS
ncbi:hypothetical protein Y032_0065g3657 [Ancylostoma ceylanicum]|uniref:Uncharacterized protein n=1 Tax=Ancylostoma ceylanicum TaxID=53326 RepID=A0A016U0M7_9BILA|nr:hypothetical protein Y032_0065g3657 [Ancylostoma ceylanicum]